ncbi:hypothetical protein AGOR_G00209090 [Albula goreensis]|uniref:Stereocilin LRR domain-containing protein n=1 Tax=Albula goreensis TaxID=1534307 RepID=A0A8T3CNG3_9TELE|nr:hypothetical protein AGOR_G00209090 [Albula goreensis]
MGPPRPPGGKPGTKEEKESKDKNREEEMNEERKDGKEQETKEEEGKERDENKKGKKGKGDKGRMRDGGKGKGRPGGPDPSRCQSRMPRLNATVMEMMGRFLTLLPANDLRGIPDEELCTLFRKPQFQDSFRGVGGVSPYIGRSLFTKVKKCHKGNQFLQYLDRLGDLACFFDNPKSLNASQSKILLDELDKCENSRSHQLKTKLVRNMMSNGSLSPDMLQSLGSSVSALPLSQLNKIKLSDLKKAMSSLSKAKWKAVNVKSLAKKLLNDSKVVSGDELLSFGTVVQGVPISLLQNIKSKDLLGTDKLVTLGKRLSKLQRKALLDGLRKDVNAVELVRSLSGDLVPSLSLATLEEANLSSVDELEGKRFTRAQSVFLLRKILGKKIKPKAIMKLKSAVQGVTCEMIDSTTQNEALEMAQALTENMHWLSNTQLCCAAKNLYSSLEKERKDYFRNITDSELKAIPTPLLLHLPVTAIMQLPASVCSSFMDKIPEANLSTLPLSSFARSALLDRALACLQKNVSDLSVDDIATLGHLACEFRPRHLSQLSTDAQNATLLALASCPQLNRNHGKAIIQLLKSTHGEPSDWPSETMTSFGRLLLLEDEEISSLKYKTWLKDTLTDLMDSLPPAQSPTPPEEFRLRPDLSTLQRKIFNLTAYAPEPSPAARRKREVMPANSPTLSMIEDLGEGNVYWSPVQLASMSTEVFSDGVSILGEIPNYSPEQLEALRNKITEVWGKASSLSEDQVLQLGCVSQGFSTSELKDLSITSVDTLEVLSPCGWMQQQREAVWQGYVDRTGLRVKDLGSVDLVGLGQFICGMSLAEARQLNTSAYREAVGDVGSVQCPLNMTEVLKEHAVLVFGEPGTWSEAQVNTLGNIIAGLNETELRSLKPNVLAFFSQSTIPLISATRLAALSTEQLQALGPDNAAMVTDIQKASLGEEQRVALGQALGVPYTRNDVTDEIAPTAAVPGSNGGASGLKIMGTIVFLQQVLLLTLRYVA